MNSTLYSESLCPDCIGFETGAWWDVYNTPGVGYGTTLGDGLGIVSFGQVSFGNARRDPTTGKITCQHGASECLFNTLEACAIVHATPFVPFIHCLSTAAAKRTPTAAVAESCATKVGVDWDVLNTCWTGAEGAALDVAAANNTATLVPPHEFVPWVTLSGAAGTFCDESGCDGFLKAACAAYTGTKPDACSA